MIGRHSSILVDPLSEVHHQCVARILSGWSSWNPGTPLPFLSDSYDHERSLSGETSGCGLSGFLKDLAKRCKGGIDGLGEAHSAEQHGAFPNADRVEVRAPRVSRHLMDVESEF